MISRTRGGWMREAGLSHGPSLASVGEAESCEQVKSSQVKSSASDLMNPPVELVSTVSLARADVILGAEAEGVQIIFMLMLGRTPVPVDAPRLPAPVSARGAARAKARSGARCGCSLCSHAPRVLAGSHVASSSSLPLPS